LLRSLLAVFALVVVAPSADAAIPWSWPVTGPIVRGYDPPDSPYGSGHRGIDVAAAIGSLVLAPDDGVVTFAGKVGGRLFLTIDHGAGVTSTCSWLTSVLVRKNDRVTRGQPVATTDWGHTDLTVPHLHFGVRLDGAYVDPLVYLIAPSVSTMIRLAPLDAPPPMATGRMTGLAYPSTPRVARLPGGRIVGGARARDDLVEPVAAISGRRRPFGVGTRGPGASVPRRMERPGRYR
jgi:murein DD-endopeptidase MepM/ murein hydrolase activator NlpD